MGQLCVTCKTYLGAKSLFTVWCGTLKLSFPGVVIANMQLKVASEQSCIVTMLTLNFGVFRWHRGMHILHVVHKASFTRSLVIAEITIFLRLPVPHFGFSLDEN